MKNPQKANDWFKQGNSLYESKRYEEALRCYDQAVNLDPGNTRAWDNRGLCFADLNRHVEAIPCYDKALQIDPKNVAGWCNRGISLSALSRDEEALQCFDKALKVDAKHSIIWQKKGDTLLNLRRHEEALRCFDQALEIDVRNADAWASKGESLTNLNRYQDALHCCDKALEINPQYVGAWYNKATVEDILGQKNDALRSYKKYINLAPDQQASVIKQARERIRQLEDEQKHSLNVQEEAFRESPQVERTSANLPSDHIYQPGDMIGQVYEVRSVLGQGGFGVVYLANVATTGKMYALKTIRDEYLADVQVKERFRKEATVWVELGRHPYLVGADGVREISGRLFIEMEYIPKNEQGLNTLSDYLKCRPPTLEQSLRWSIQVCYGMEFAYSKGIRAHRDLKPDNIMISQEGNALITDLGLASILDASPAGTGATLSMGLGNNASSGKTQMGVGLGTPLYMPPEQFENAVGCDQRSDIYSMGVILFQMANGDELPLVEIPLSGRSRAESIPLGLAMQQLNREIAIPELNSPLFPMIRRCLHKEPSRRYQHFSELRLELEALLERQCGEVFRPSQLQRLDVLELYNKASSLQDLGQYEEALRSFEVLTKFDPCQGMFWDGKGLALDYLGRHDEALRSYDQALKLDPNVWAVWSNKGNCCDSLGQHEEALHCFDKALELDPSSAKIWNNKATCLSGIGRYADAVTCYEQSLRLDPRNTRTLNNIGLTLKSLGRQDEAIQYLDRALKINPMYAHAWNSKGISWRTWIDFRRPCLVSTRLWKLTLNMLMLGATKATTSSSWAILKRFSIASIKFWKLTLT